MEQLLLAVFGAGGVQSGAAGASVDEDTALITWHAHSGWIGEIQACSLRQIQRALLAFLANVSHFSVSELPIDRGKLGHFRFKRSNGQGLQLFNCCCSWTKSDHGPRR